MTLVDAEETARDRGYLSILEPACGAGVMAIEAANVLRRRRVPFYVQAWDVDETAALMCYVQLYLLDVAAIVVVGNSLTREVRDSWVTERFVLGGWEARLRRDVDEGTVTKRIEIERDERVVEVEPRPAPVAIEESEETRPPIRLDVDEVEPLPARGQLKLW
jgi:hypothetical protein